MTNETQVEFESSIPNAGAKSAAFGDRPLVAYRVPQTLAIH